MESYTKEEFEQIPEFLRNEYTEQEDGTYVHGLSKTLKSNLNDLDNKNKTLTSQFNELEEKMNTFESKKAEDIEAAKAKALEDARSKKDVEEIERQYQEKMADLEQRVSDRVRGEVTNEFTVKQATDSLNNDVKLLATELAVDDSAKVALELLIKQRTKIDDNGVRVYMGEDGSALSITELKAFKEELAKSPSLSRLVKGELPSNGGGLLNGGQGGGSANANNAKAEKAIKAGDLTGYLQSQFNR